MTTTDGDEEPPSPAPAPLSGTPGNGAPAPEHFTKMKRMELPREIIVGHNAVERTREVVGALGLDRKCLIVCDPNTQEIIGERIEAELLEEGVEVDHHLIEDSSHEETVAVMERISLGGFGFVVGAGGGRPIDVAKLSSFNARTPFPSIIPKFLNDIFRLQHLKKEIIAFCLLMK